MKKCWYVGLIRLHILVVGDSHAATLSPPASTLWKFGRRSKSDYNPLVQGFPPPTHPHTHRHTHTHTWIHPEGRGWNEMTWKHVMLCYVIMLSCHVAISVKYQMTMDLCHLTLLTYLRKRMAWHDKWQAGSWVSRIPYREQVQAHASMNPSTTSSIASLGNIGRWAVAPLLIPFDSGFPTHTHKRGEGRREGTRTASHNQQRKNGGNNKGRTGRGSTQQASGEQRQGNGGRGKTAHRTQPWQAEEQERKAKHATKQRDNWSRTAKGRNKRTPQQGERGDRVGGWEVGEEREGKKRTGKESVRTAPIRLTWGSGRCTHLYSCMQGRTEEGGKKGNVRPGPHTRSMRVLLRLMATSPMWVLRP